MLSENEKNTGHESEMLSESVYQNENGECDEHNHNLLCIGLIFLMKF